MAKKAKAKLPVVNRRALSRREREDRYRHWLYIGGGGIMALIVGVLAVMVIQLWVITPASPVATVNGTPIRTDTYQRWFRYQRYQLNDYLARVEQQIGQMNPNDETQQFLYQYLEQQQIQLQSQAANLPLSSLDELIDRELIRQEAARRSITVTPAEVQKEIEQSFGYNLDPPTPTPTPANTATPAATATPLSTATPAATATVTGTIESAATPAATATVTGTVESTATPAASPTPAISPTPAASPTPMPSPTPMSEEYFKKIYNDYLQNIQKNAGFGEANFRDIVASDLLRKKLQEAMAKEVPTSEEQIHASHILVNTEEEAKAALERLKKGEDFATVAKEVSQDTASKENGGDLGWFARGQMVEAFDQAAFALQQPGQLSDLVQTDYGYHIIKLQEREANRPLDETQLANKRSRAVDDWLKKQRESDGVKRFWSSDKVPPEKQPQQQPAL